MRLRIFLSNYWKSSFSPFIYLFIGLCVYRWSLATYLHLLFSLVYFYAHVSCCLLFMFCVLCLVPCVWLLKNQINSASLMKYIFYFTVLNLEDWVLCLVPCNLDLDIESWILIVDYWLLSNANKKLYFFKHLAVSSDLRLEIWVWTVDEGLESRISTLCIMRNE